MGLGASPVRPRAVTLLHLLQTGVEMLSPRPDPMLVHACYVRGSIRAVHAWCGRRCPTSRFAALLASLSFAYRRAGNILKTKPRP